VKVPQKKYLGKITKYKSSNTKQVILLYFTLSIFQIFQ